MNPILAQLIFALLVVAFSVGVGRLSLRVFPYKKKVVKESKGFQHISAVELPRVMEKEPDYIPFEEISEDYFKSFEKDGI